MPIIVMHQSNPNTMWVKAIQIPPTRIQIIFINKYKQPEDRVPCLLVLPKGQRAIIPSFIVCTPNGMPTIVMIRNKLAAKYSIAIIKPPNINQRMFPSIFMLIKINDNCGEAMLYVHNAYKVYLKA